MKRPAGCCALASCSGVVALATRSGVRYSGRLGFGCWLLVSAGVGAVFDLLDVTSAGVVSATDFDSPPAAWKIFCWARRPRGVLPAPRITSYLC